MSDRDLSTSRTQVFGPPPNRGTYCRVCERDVESGRESYCSDWCRQIASSVMSLLNWGGVRRRVLERDEHTCVECGFKQGWLDRGYDHLRELAEEQLPERPDSPSALRIGKGEVSDDELERAAKAHDAWFRRRAELIHRYFGDRRHFGEDPQLSGRYWPVPESHLEVDHITPFSEGGHPFDPANLQTLCRDCHRRKTALEASDRAEQREMPRPEIKLVEFGIGGDG